MKAKPIYKGDDYIPPSAWRQFRHKPYADLEIRKGGDAGGEAGAGAVLPSEGGDQGPEETHRPGGEIPEGDGRGRIPGI